MSRAARRGGWEVEDRTGSATGLHAAWPTVDERPERRTVAVCRPRGAALVLGSTQPGWVVDRAAAAARGVEVARRRSGGGAVLVGPADPLWIEVWLPAGDPLLDRDVGRAFLWLGEAWARALDRLGAGGVAVVGAPSRHRLSAVAAAACFGSASSGEVLVGGRKVVGLAQRRGRAGAHFQAACLGSWDPGPLVELLAPELGAGGQGPDELASAAAGLADLLSGDPEGLLERAADAFFDTLP